MPMAKYKYYRVRHQVSQKICLIATFTLSNFKNRYKR